MCPDAHAFWGSDADDDPQPAPEAPSAPAPAGPAPGDGAPQGGDNQTQGRDHGPAQSTGPACPAGAAAAEVAAEPPQADLAPATAPPATTPAAATPVAASPGPRGKPPAEVAGGAAPAELPRDPLSAEISAQVAGFCSRLEQAPSPLPAVGLPRGGAQPPQAAEGTPQERELAVDGQPSSGQQ
mmetsp:Transcript_31158/g.78729  ORF Transcript_31158/g.78729 Transcript_31158/m.78729 type:complete len:183 (+) Transcript_31158:1-549(+)